MDVEAHRFWLRALRNASNAEQMIMDNIEIIQRQLDIFDEGVKFYSKCDTELSVCISFFFNSFFVKITLVQIYFIICHRD